MELRQHSILRISDEKTLELIDLYEKEECLWNTFTPDYKSRHKRQAAAERIAKKLDIKHFTSRFVTIKFKNLRNSYCQELKKVATSVKDGDRPTYQPKVFWFNKMDSFVRPHLQRLQHTKARKPRRSAKEPAGQSAVEPARQPIKELARPPVMEPARPPIIEPARQPLKEPARPPVMGPARPPIMEPARQPIKEPASARPPGMEPARPPIMEPARQPTKEPAWQPIKEPARPPVMEPARTSVMEQTVQNENTADPEVVVKIEPPDQVEGQTAPDEEGSSVPELEMSPYFPADYFEDNYSGKDTEEPITDISQIIPASNRRRNEEVHHTRPRVEESQPPVVDNNELARLMKDISSHLHVLTTQNNNCFDSFGKYVASMLKNMPYQRAMVVQPRIMDLLIEAAVMD